MQKIGDRVRAVRKKIGLTQRQFALKTQIPLRTLAAIEINENKPGYDLMVKLCKIAGTFNVPIQWLMFGEEGRDDVPFIVPTPKKELSLVASSPKEEYGVEKLVAIPVIDNVPAGYPDYPVLDDNVREHVYIPGVPKGAFGLLVCGDSMIPDLDDGDIVVINPGQKDFKSGELGVFRLTTGATVKYYYKEGDSAWLQPKNPKYPPIILTDELECVAVGKVICKIIMVK